MSDQNLLENGDFSATNGSSPAFWAGMSDTLITIHPTEKLNGKNCCITSNRTKSSHGPCQNILYAVKLGRRYKLSAYVRLDPSLPHSRSEKIRAKLEYQPLNDKTNAYVPIVSPLPVTAAEWVEVTGILNMPVKSEKVPSLQKARLYFSGPATDANFMLADVSLVDYTGDTRKGVEHSMPTINTELKLSKECSDGSDSGAPVFLSYQWGVQKRVKLLREKLEECGIRCWMDIGKMGGGDELYAEIDKGMREAKVVISCITPKYAKSENCQREVTLADCLKKPIIPIILDKEQQWPPVGQMSMIFAKLLYINMCGQGEDEDEDFPAMKFEELVSEIKERL